MQLEVEVFQFKAMLTSVMCKELEYRYGYLGCSIAKILERTHQEQVISSELGGSSMRKVTNLKQFQLDHKN
jgi:hypothetical protein